MKLTHENIKLIESWLTQYNLEPSLSDDFVRKVYDEVLENLYKLNRVESINKRKRYYTLQYDFVRRDLLKILYKQNNKSVNNIAAGYVYAIGNPAWPNFIKIGSTIDITDRLATYQTSSPFRDYYVISYFFTHNRLADEKLLHSSFKDRNAEWCFSDVNFVVKLFKQKLEERHVKVLPEKLTFVKNQIKESEEKVKKQLEEKRAKKHRKRQAILRNLQKNKNK